MTTLVGTAPASEIAIAPRVVRVTTGGHPLRQSVDKLLALSLRGLPLMFDPGRRRFAHTRKLVRSGAPQIAGLNTRYDAIVVLGAMYLPDEQQRQVFCGQSALEFCGGLIDDALKHADPGAIALVAWAAAELAHPDMERAFQRLEQVWINDGQYIVTSAWALSAGIAARSAMDTSRLVQSTRAALLGAFNASAGIFPHEFKSVSWARAHVACFADQVYPIQALSRYHKAFGDAQCLAAANRCAAQICRLQGPAGQWWWHYDHRTGKVVEGYPVYSVHQHAMGPMALLDLFDAGGDDHAESIRKGLSWLQMAPEVGRSLIEERHDLIWRKVARNEPNKLSRKIRAGVSRLFPACRLSALNLIFRPTRIDFECRPYELGWLLHAWLGGLK